MTEKPKTDQSRQFKQIIMRNIFKGSLRGHVCEDCFEVISNVDILFYLPYTKETSAANAIADTKETFRLVTKEEAKRRQESVSYTHLTLPTIYSV